MAQFALVTTLAVSPLDTLHSAAVRDSAIQYALTFTGKPYSWGGDDAVAGFDCSGLVIEVLKSVGAFPRGQDMTSHGLYTRYRDHSVPEPYAGCLLFWGSSIDKIKHVEMAVNDWQAIGASGGGSKTLTRQDAIDHNAFVKMRPIAGRKRPLVAIVDPLKEI